MTVLRSTMRVPTKWNAPPAVEHAPCLRTMSRGARVGRFNRIGLAQSSAACDPADGSFSFPFTTTRRRSR